MIALCLKSLEYKNIIFLAYIESPSRFGCCLLLQPFLLPPVPESHFMILLKKNLWSFPVRLIWLHSSATLHVLLQKPEISPPYHLPSRQLKLLQTYIRDHRTLSKAFPEYSSYSFQDIDRVRHFLITIISVLYTYSFP